MAKITRFSFIIGLFVTLVVLAGISVGIYYLVKYIKNKQSSSGATLTLAPYTTIQSVTPVNNVKGDYITQDFATVNVSIQNCKHNNCQLGIHAEVYDSNGNSLGETPNFSHSVTNGNNTVSIPMMNISGNRNGFPSNLNIYLRATTYAGSTPSGIGNTSTYSGSLNFTSA